MRYIGDIDLNIGQSYLSDWNEVLAVKELIANAIDETETGDKDILIEEISKDTWSITNYGNEIIPDNFLMNEGKKSIKKGKIGKFGIGLKDAIAVLTTRNINIEIITSQYIFKPIYKSKCNLVKEVSLFIEVYANNRSVKGTQIILSECSKYIINKAKYNFLKYRYGHYNVIEFTEYGEVILEDSKVNNGTIYLNGMKIAKDSKLLFSYNILLEDRILKKNLIRERKNISKEVYSSSLQQIIKTIKGKVVQDKYLDRLLTSKHGSMRGELIYKETIIKTVRYALNNNFKLVFFTKPDRQKYYGLYSDLSKIDKIKLIILNEKYYKYIKDDDELMKKNIFADSYKLSYREISVEELNDGERNVFDLVKELIVFHSGKIGTFNIVISENKDVAYEPENDKIIISRKSLRYVHKCFLEVINAIRDSCENGEDFKDYIFMKFVNNEVNNIKFKNKVIDKNKKQA
ncbi:hypothetical protein ACH36K_11360 [Clostridium sp. MB05]|uniref:hypothetical protein n=1 Tax=Clostridium sp. MB05 TaxID=3376682 RepID=UPI003981DBBE